MALTAAEHSRRYRSSEKGKAENQERMRRRRARLRSCGDKASAHYRRRIDWLGWSPCVLCTKVFPSAGIEVDHRLALSLGGCDVADNLQPLCVPCHRRKTRIEAAWR